MSITGKMNPLLNVLKGKIKRVHSVKWEKIDSKLQHDIIDEN